MSEEVLTEDQSHYEISLTAGQAFVAFVLLLLSLAAAFAFGLLIGKGQNDDRFAFKRDSAVISEAALTPAPKKTQKAAPVPVEDFKPTVTEATAPTSVTPAALAPAPTQSAPNTGPAYAQLLSSSDQKAAEALAEKLIGAGFNTSYVERMVTDKGTTFRVRVRFASDAEAKAAEAKLRTFSKDVWITSK